MSNNIKQQFVQDYGEAYVRFGFPKLMGRIVGILLYSDKALSLDDITCELGVSKGPVSQIIRRLRDHNLVQPVWIHGDRKDYYQVHPDVFGIAFQNSLTLIKTNLTLAKKYLDKIENKDVPGKFAEWVNEMYDFYKMMISEQEKFLELWHRKKSKMGTK